MLNSLIYHWNTDVKTYKIQENCKIGEKYSQICKIKKKTKPAQKNIINKFIIAYII